MIVLGFRRNKLLSAGKCTFAAIIPGGGPAFPFSAAIGGFLREFIPTEAVEGFEKQQNCYQADRNVNAATHFDLRIADPIDSRLPCYRRRRAIGNLIAP